MRSPRACAWRRNATERGVRALLPHAVQVDLCVDLDQPAAEPAERLFLERRERRRGRRFRFRRGAARRGGRSALPSSARLSEVRRRSAAVRSRLRRSSLALRLRSGSHRLRAGDPRCPCSAFVSARHSSTRASDRNERDHRRGVADAAGARAGRAARAEEDVAARRADDRRAGVLRDHQPAERPASCSGSASSGASTKTGV